MELYAILTAEQNDVLDSPESLDTATVVISGEGKAAEILAVVSEAEADGEEEDEDVEEAILHSMVKVKLMGQHLIHRLTRCVILT